MLNLVPDIKYGMSSHGRDLFGADFGLWYGRFKVTHLDMSNVKSLCYHTSVLVMDIMALISLISIWWNN